MQTVQPTKSVEMLFLRKRKRRIEEKNILHHSHAVNWFSAVNLRSLFGQAISKMREHEMISQHIYLDKSRGC